VIRAVLDTNTLASGFLDNDGIPRKLINRWIAGEFELVLSKHILDELDRTLVKPYFQTAVSKVWESIVRNRMRSDAIHVQILGSLRGIASQPEDDPVIETALVGNADCLVTGDRQLRKLSGFRGLAIVNPFEFSSYFLPK
jgi:putative PIN family toxin of toxin-antitoxin system